MLLTRWEHHIYTNVTQEVVFCYKFTIYFEKVRSSQLLNFVCIKCVYAIFNTSHDYYKVLMLTQRLVVYCILHIGDPRRGYFIKFSVAGFSTRKTIAPN